MPLPLDEVDSAKTALTESAKKVSDLKTRQWEIVKNAVLILVFLAAVFQGDLKYDLLQHSEVLQYVVVFFVFGYFCTIFWQAVKNGKRYKSIYIKAGLKLYSADAKKEYFDDDADNMIEDEGRLQWFLFLVVVFQFLLIVFQIHARFATHLGHAS